MYDPAPQRGPATPAEWWFVGILVAIIFGLFAAEICFNYTPAKLSVLLVVLFWIPLLVLHEAGHAVVALVFGWHVSQVVIGVGKTIGGFRIGKTEIEIRAFAFEGFVKCVPTKLNLPGLENALIYFAGPGIELLLALGLLLIVGPDQLLSASDDYRLIFCQSLALAAASQAVLNLIPFATSTPEGEIPSDGLGIILSLLRPKSDYAELITRADNERDHP